MRLTTVILLATLMHVSATGLSQRITLNSKQDSLENVLKEIHRQSGYDFFFDRKVIQKIKPVTITVNNASLEETLSNLLKGLPLMYNIEDKIIIIKEQPFYNKLLPITAKGRVTGQDMKPLPGATIRVRGTDKVTTANSNGEFTLTDLPKEAILQISYIGYITLEVQAIAISGTNYTNIGLQTLESRLDEVQVIAYGTSIKRFSVGSVAGISAAEIAKQPVTNVLLALQGQVPGLVINSLNGAPGSKVNVQVRGQNTLRANLNGNSPFDQPLFIIDGVPMASQNENINLLQSMGTQSSNIQSGFSAFNNINPSDIESISVLKDADATSIYGSQGANGVIIITTKKGQPGKTDLNITVNTGVNAITRRVNLLNTPQYLALRHEALNNDGVTLPPAYDGSNPDLLLFDTTKYTNWSKKFFGNTSNNTDVHVSLSGGTQSSTFILTGGYTHASYNFPGDFGDNRLTFHSGFNHKSKDNKFTVDFGTDYSYDHNNSSGQPSVTAALQLAPNFPDMLDANGNLIWNYKGMDLTGYQQYSYLKQPSNLNSYQLSNTMRLSYLLIKGLKLSANLGYSRLTTDETSVRPLSSQSPTYAYSKAFSTFAKNNFQTINIEPQLDYTRQVGKGRLTALVGGTYKKNQSSNEILQGTDYANDGLLGSITGAKTVYAVSAGNPYKYAALYGRIGYIYDNKYILNFTGRRDGSSNFGPGRQLGNFGSAGAGWIFSEAYKLPFMSYGKISANYGTNGSDGIAAYQYQAYWTSDAFGPLFQNLSSYHPLNLYNPDYSWATKKSLNIALDLGFFQDKLLINTTWYRNRESNQLLGTTLPSQTGFNSVLQNFAATVQNKGLEFSVTSNNIQHKNFSWTTNFNITANRNKLIAFPGLATSPYAALYTLGRSTSTINGYRYKSVNDTTGIFQFYTAKGTTTYNPDFRTEAQGGDKMPIADLQPKFFGGLGNTFTWKGFSLTAFLQFSKQQARNYLYSIYSNQPPGTQNNVPVEMLDRWRKPGDQAPLQKATQSFFNPAYTAASAFSTSSGVISDASYIRLKTLSFSYSFKVKGVKSCRVYANAQNLFTITNYKVGDPETPGELSVIPLQKTIAAGLSLTF
jgi:TonB-linked SusC/RagA family outer membrane protein